MTLILHHSEPNGASLKPLMTLFEKGAAFESRWRDWTSPSADAVRECELEAFHDLDPEGPVLVHDGQVVTDSLFMIQYLDAAVRGPSLMPSDADALWDLLTWGRMCAETLAPSVATLGCRAHLTPALRNVDRKSLRQAIARIGSFERRTAWQTAYDDAYPQEDMESARRKIGLVVQKIEAVLLDRPWLLGETFSLCDIDVFASAGAAPLLGVAEDPAQWPQFHDWLRRIKARPSYGQALALTRSGAPETAFSPGPEHSRWG